MKVVRIETLPSGHFRCTHDDGTTMTLEPDKLEEYLRENPMPSPAENAGNVITRFRQWWNRR